MTIDKFGSHISHKYSDENGYYLCYIPLHVRDYEKTFVLKDLTKVITYKINDQTNTWSFPLPPTVVQTCRVFNFAIKFILNDRIVDSLEGETLTKNDTLFVIRSENSAKTGDGIIELIVKTPISIDDYE